MNNFGAEYLNYEFLEKYTNNIVENLYFTKEEYLNKYPRGYIDNENKFPAVIDKIKFSGDNICVRFLHNNVFFHMYISLFNVYWSNSYTPESILYLEFDNKKTIWLSGTHPDPIIFKNEELVFNNIYIMSHDFTLEHFLNIADSNKDKYITQFLTNTDILLGISNELKCEILAYSKISPKRQLNSLSQDKLEKIFEAIIVISRLLFNTTINLYKYEHIIYEVKGAKKDKLQDNLLTYWNPEKQF
jgi:hypothetical protein